MSPCIIVPFESDPAGGNVAVGAGAGAFDPKAAKLVFPLLARVPNPPELFPDPNEAAAAAKGFELPALANDNVGASAFASLLSELSTLTPLSSVEAAIDANGLVSAELEKDNPAGLLSPTVVVPVLASLVPN